MAQDVDLFVSEKDWQGECKYEIETVAKEARIFYYKSDFQIDSRIATVVDNEIILHISPITKLVLIYLKENGNEKHIWISIEKDGEVKNTLRHLFLGNAYSGEYSEVTGIDADFEKALSFFNTYKSESLHIDNKLYSERYWNVKRTLDSSTVLMELLARAEKINNPDEYEILIRNLVAVGDTIVSDKLKNQFVKNYPSHPEAIEMATWQLRKESYLTKNNAERFQHYKQYQQQVAMHKGNKANSRIEIHKAQFLIRLYDYYAEKGYDWYKEVAEFSSSNQVYVYSITASNIQKKSPLEAMNLIEKALAVNDEKLTKELDVSSIFLVEEQRKIAQKCKEFPYFLKGKMYLQNKKYTLAAEALEKAVNINEFLFSNYYEAYLDALIALVDKEKYLVAFENIKQKEKLNEKYHKAKEEFLKVEEVVEAMAVNETLGKLPETSFDTKEGAKLNTERFKNKTVVLNFWSNSCENCIKSFPEMYYLQKVYAPSDVAFYWVNIEPWQFDDASFRQAIASLKEKGFAEFNQLFDFNGEARKAFKISSVPSKIVIDPAGNIRYFDESDNVSEIENILKTILKEQVKPSK